MKTTRLVLALFCAISFMGYVPEAHGIICVICDGEDPGSSNGDEPSCEGGVPDDPSGSGSGCSGCGEHLTAGSGLAYWWVEEPHINLFVEDEPLGYQPAHGKRVAFRLFYQQRGAATETATTFGVGPGWSSSFRAYMFDFTGTPVLHRGGLGAVEYQALGVNTSRNPRNGSITTTLWNGQTPAGYTVDHKNGARYYFGTEWDGSFFLTTYTDPNGHSTTYSYSTTDDILRLISVTDAAGLVTDIHYDSAAFPNQITSVEDPFNRTCTLQYDENPASASYGRLTNIVDVIGMASGFQYDAATTWLTNLTTPYGATGFRHGGPDAAENQTELETGNVVNRFIEVSEPNGSKQLLLYRHDCSSLLAAERGAIPSPQGLTNTFDNVDQDQRNSFRWDRLQYDSLSSGYRSTGDPANLSTNDYAIGRLRHWLKAPGKSFGDILSLERAPRPDAGVSEGKVTWYDYEGKDTSNKNVQGTNSAPWYVAVILPDGTTRFTRTTRNLYGLPTEAISSYTKPDATLWMRTNLFTYAGNLLDLQLQIGPAGEQVVSNWFNNSYHQPDASYDALNQETRYTFNANRQVTSIKRPSGLTTTNVYFPSGDYAGWLDKTIDLEISRTNAYTYANGLVQTHTDERTLTTTHYWDALQRLTGMNYPDGTTTSNRYTALDVTATKDRLGNWSYFGYNAIRRRIAETNANNIVTLYSYCTCGSLDSVTAAYGTAQAETTSYFYDLQGRRWLTVLPDGTGITNAFDSLGQLQATDDGTGTRWLYYNNNQGLLTNVLTSHGYLQSTTFDIEDRPIYATDANGVTVTNTYDELGRLRTRTYPDGGVESYGHTQNLSGPTSYTNQLSKVTRFVYDVANRKTFETNANNEVIGYSYNSAGDLLTLKDGKNQTTTWQYDGYGRVTNKLDQLGVSILTYTYDANSRLATRWSKQKGTTSYSYDPVGNLTNINYPASTDVALKYDPLNRLTNMVDAVGTTAFSWLAGGQLWKEDGPWASDTVTNSYTKRLRTGLGLLQPTGYWTNGYKYDLARRLTNVASVSGNFSYAYAGGAGGASSASSLIQKLTLPNSGYITNHFDSAGRLLFTKLLTSGGAVTNKHEYYYNPGNQRTNQLRYDDSTVSYAYDEIGQLKTASPTNSGGTWLNTEQRGYTYDTAWNLSYRTNGTTTQSFKVNGKNELTNSVGTINKYDASGNLTNSGTVYYGYDDENRLTEAWYTASVNPNSWWWTMYVYDGQSRLRLAREYKFVPDPPEGPEGPGSEGGTWVLKTETRYVYDGNLVMQERNSNNIPTVNYTRGNDLSGTREGAGGIGGLLARSHGYSSGTWSTHNYYHADGNGNVTFLLANDQTLSARYVYDPYGRLISSSGSLATANTYRFSSKEIHGRTGFYYYGYRWYAPEMQRWVNRDPIQDQPGTISRGMLRQQASAGWNLYQFCTGMPVNLVDTDGRSLWSGIKHLGGALTVPFGGGGKCCNNSPNWEWWVEDGIPHPLAPGQCIGGEFIGADCDGLSCGGKFYKVGNLVLLELPGDIPLKV